MNISQYLMIYPYRTAWLITKLMRRKYQTDYFCGGYVDYICFKGIHKLLPEIRIVASNYMIMKELKSYGIKSVLYPTYPDMVIMARHLARKYPSKNIVKIGMRHGAYHFKDFVESDRYNIFEKYLFTSMHEVTLAKKRNINNGIAVGFPKIDSMFNGEITQYELSELKNKLKLDLNKKTIIFTSTWDKKGYSAIDKWINRVDDLSFEYNVLITVHEWLSLQKKNILANLKNVTFINDKYTLPYLMIADVMIADTSSIIAEFCSLNKPIITFRVPETKRFTKEILSMLEEISFRIDNFDELKPTLIEALKQPKIHEKKRIFYNRLMFDELDGHSSFRVVGIIKQFWQKA